MFLQKIIISHFVLFKVNTRSLDLLPPLTLRSCRPYLNFALKSTSYCSMQHNSFLPNHKTICTLTICVIVIIDMWRTILRALDPHDLSYLNVINDQ